MVYYFSWLTIRCRYNKTDHRHEIPQNRRERKNFCWNFSPSDSQHKDRMGGEWCAQSTISHFPLYTFCTGCIYDFILCPNAGIETLAYLPILLPNSSYEVHKQEKIGIVLLLVLLNGPNFQVDPFRTRDFWNCSTLRKSRCGRLLFAGDGDILIGRDESFLITRDESFLIARGRSFFIARDERLLMAHGERLLIIREGRFLIPPHRRFFFLHLGQKCFYRP